MGKLGAWWIGLLLFSSCQVQQETVTESEQKPGVWSGVSIVYSSEYLIDLGGLERLHPFDINKYQKIFDQLVADQLLKADDVHAPTEVTESEIRLVHTEEYLEKLKDRENVAAYLEAEVLKHTTFSLDEAILKPFRYACGGTLLAGRLALKNGVAINLAGGYHHAKPDQGEGFCLYADIPIAIRQLQKENVIRKAIVIDVDAHQGNGTAVCLADDDTTWTFSIHQGDIYPIPKEKSDRDVEIPGGTDDQAYLEILKQQLPDVLEQCDADICFIVGGCDTAANDPLAGVEMTLEGIVRRDAAIVEACHERNIPVVFTLAGGYSQEAWKIQYSSIKHMIEQYSLAPPSLTAPSSP